MSRRGFAFGAVAFFVIALDLLDQGRTVGCILFSVLSFVSAVTGIYYKTKKK